MFRRRFDAPRQKKYTSYDTVTKALDMAKKSLDKNNLRVFYRDITTVDAMQSGVSVIKAVSPDMAQIFAHQRWPFLDKVDTLAVRNYPDIAHEAVFPNMSPHPLG